MKKEQSKEAQQQKHQEGHRPPAEGSDPTLFIAVLIGKMQRMPILPDADTEAAKIFSAHLSVNQHSLEQMMIARGLRTH